MSKNNLRKSKDELSKAVRQLNAGYYTFQNNSSCVYSGDERALPNIKNSQNGICLKKGTGLDSNTGKPSIYYVRGGVPQYGLNKQEAPNTFPAPGALSYPFITSKNVCPPKIGDLTLVTKKGNGSLTCSDLSDPNLSDNWGLKGQTFGSWFDRNTIEISNPLTVCEGKVCEAPCSIFCPSAADRRGLSSEALRSRVSAQSPQQTF